MAETNNFNKICNIAMDSNSGILPTKELTKKKLYNMMLKQRRVLEHSPTI